MSVDTTAPASAPVNVEADDLPPGRGMRLTNWAANYIDERTGMSGLVKELGRKIFPDHWSFMLGEVALYSFVVILLSGLQAIDSSVYEAAALDGAGRMRRIWSITVPLIRRTLMFSVVLQTLAVFQMFAEPFVVTQGGPYSSTTTAGLYLYNHITRGDLGTGAANSFLLVILVMALSLGFVRLLRAKD